MNTELSSRKDDEKAKKLKITGDCYFRNFDYEKAVESYNASICYAPPFSNQLPIGYMERAKVYTRIGLHNEALKSIDYALSLDFNGDLRIQIYQKKEQCIERICHEKELQMKKMKVFSIQNPSVVGGVNLKVPFASDCLEIKESEQYGRYLTTKKDLNPGEIICLEPAYIKVVNENFIYRKCTHCLKSNHFNLLPCYCCAMVMFCSERCRDYATYHKYECPIIANILYELCDNEYKTLSWLTFRQLVLTIRWYPHFQDLTELYEESENVGFNFKRFNFETALQKAYLKYILCLTVKPKYEKEYAKIEHICSDMVKLLLQKTTYKKIVKNYIYDTTFELEQFKTLLIKVAMKFFYINLTNVYSLVTTPEWLDKSEPTRGEAFALALFPFTTLINHACVCNVKALFVGEGSNDFMIYVNRPISAGRQIFICYQKNMNYLETPLEKRRQVTFDEFCFVCACTACTNNYSLGSKLKHLSLLSKEESEFLLQNSEKLRQTRVTIEDINLGIKVYSKIIQKYVRHYPCLDIFEIEKLLDHCMVLLYRNRPYRYV